MLVAVSFSGFGCARATTPEPKVAVTDLAQAVQKRDARAVHALLDDSSRRNITVAEVAILLERDGAEIEKQLRGWAAAPAPRVDAAAVLPGGERVELRQADGQYYVDETSGLLAVAVTPREALIGLRRALEQPDYDLLLQLLSSDVRQAVESQRQALVQALADVEVLDVVVQGDRAVVNTADGHRVELSLESGVWRVRDFE